MALGSISRRVGVLFLAAGALVASVPLRAAERPEAVAVVDSALAARWLTQCGIPCARRSGASLGGNPIQNARILVLPVDSVRTPGAARVVNDFVAGGGKVLAVYWGTVTAQENAQVSPAYGLAKLFGIRPVGWLGDCPDALDLVGAGSGSLPYGGARVGLGSAQTLLAEPTAGTKVLARWQSGGATGGHNSAVFKRGNVVYLAPNLLRPNNDRTEARELFFWALQRLSPGDGPQLQARDRVATASAEVAAAAGQLQSTDTPELRTQVEACRAVLAEARAQMARSAVQAIATADRARGMAARLQDRLREEHKRQ